MKIYGIPEGCKTFQAKSYSNASEFYQMIDFVTQMRNDNHLRDKYKGDSEFNRNVTKQKESRKL